MKRQWRTLRGTVTIALALSALAPAAARAQKPATALALAAALTTGHVSPVARRTLAAGLARVLARSGLRSSKVGAVVVDLRSGETLFEKNADELFNPASVTKVVTSAVALRRLSPEFKFVTTVASLAQPAEDKLGGDLYVMGGGDPKLTTETMYKLASNVAALGIRRVSGGIVVDESYFDDERLGAGWDQDKSDRPYQAPVGAASVNFNSLEVRVYPGAKAGAPARVLTDPATSFVRIDNDATTSALGKAALRVRSLAKGEHNVFDVTGSIPVKHRGWTAWRKIDNPPLYFGTLFKEMLARAGVTVSGKVKVGRSPAGARSLTVLRSASLAVLLTDVNKVSQNFMAEQILKTIGAQTAGRPGSWQSGIRAVEELLGELGIARGTYTFKNGSGLNDVNRFTPRQLTTLLTHMFHHFPTAAEFTASLAVAGADGSIKRRLSGNELYRRVRAKTGWLRGVSCLAGYSGGKRPLAFALFLNRVKASGAGHRAQQEVARLLASFAGRP